MARLRPLFAAAFLAAADHLALCDAAPQHEIARPSDYLVAQSQLLAPHSQEEHSNEREIESKFNLWYAGILTFLVGTLLQAFGANLQRWSAENEAEGPLETEGAFSWCSRSKALIGLALFASGGIVCSVSLIFASEALVAPLVLLLFVFNPIIAYYMNNEPFDWWTDSICTALVMLGVGLVEGFSPHTSAAYSVHRIEWLFRQSTCIGFFSVVVGCLAIAFYAQRRISETVQLAPSGYPVGDHGWKGGFLFVSFGSIAGAIGGLNVTLTKVIFSILVDVASSGFSSVFGSWVLYFAAVLVVVTYVLELNLTAIGLHKVGAMVFLPSFAVVEQLVIAMGSLLFFQDYPLFSTLAATMFAVGNAIALAAVVAMAYFRLQLHGETRSLLSGKKLAPVIDDDPPKSGLLCFGC